MRDDPVFGIGIRIIFVVILCMLVLAITGVTVALVSTFAHARDDGQWSNQSPEIRAWFNSVMVPPANTQSCCGEADAFDAKMDGDYPDGTMKVEIINGRGVFEDGTVMAVPRSVIQTKYGNPLEKIILFIGLSSGKPICLIPKVGA